MKTFSVPGSKDSVLMHANIKHVRTLTSAEAVCGTSRHQKKEIRSHSFISRDLNPTIIFSVKVFLDCLSENK